MIARDGSSGTCQGGLKYRRKHDVMYEKSWAEARHATGWTRDAASAYPQWMSLPKRDQELMDLHGIKLPHPVLLVVHSCQSNLCIGEDYSPCMCPSGTYYLAHRGRMMEPIERLATQGIWLPKSIVHLFPLQTIND